MGIKKAVEGKDGLAIRHFASEAAWAKWLAANHARAPGVWLRFAKKDGDNSSVSKAAALETALCYGWIDSQAASAEGGFWLLRFTPRRPQSKWSAINCAAAERLIAAERMQPAGLREVEAAKRDGRWDRAYAPQRTITVPPTCRRASMLSHAPGSSSMSWTARTGTPFSFGCTTRRDPTPGSGVSKNSCKC